MTIFWLKDVTTFCITYGVTILTLEGMRMKKTKLDRQIEKEAEKVPESILEIFQSGGYNNYGVSRNIVFRTTNQSSIKLVQLILDREKEIETLKKTIKTYQDASSSIMAAAT